jgi:putative phosphoribosyl transferase
MLLNEPLVKVLGLTGEQIEGCVAEEKEVIERRLRLFRDEKPFPSVEDRAVLVVDDGLASGFSMLTTLRTLRLRGAGKIVVGVPTAHEGAIELIRPSADVIVCLNVRSSHFYAVADAYISWYDLDDDEVSSLLKESPLYLEWVADGGCGEDCAQDEGRGQHTHRHSHRGGEGEARGDDGWARARV